MRTYNSQLELVSTGVCRGEIEVPTEELAKREWYKYKTDGTPDGRKIKTSAEEIYTRLGVKSRPWVSPRQTHITMFNSALDEAISRAENLGHNARGNIVALYAGSTKKQMEIPLFLDYICEHVGLHPNNQREFIQQACASFNNGVNRLSDYAEENPGLEGYAIVGASEILRPMWRQDNFDSMIFGDLAGVAIFKITHSKNLAEKDRGIRGNVNSHTPDINGDIVFGEDGFLYMNGVEVIKAAPQAMIETFRKSLALAELNIRDMNKFIFHPGSGHVYHKTGLKLRRIYGEDMEIATQLPNCLDDSGNNGGATIINILHRQLTQGKISRNDKVYMGAIGQGYYEAGFIINGFPFLAQ